MKNLFMNRIQDEMDNGQFNAAICMVSPLHSQITSLGLLTFYLREKGEKGIFVSIIRPHYYIQRLLVKEHLPIDNLVMFDAVNRNGEVNTPGVIKPNEILEGLDGRLKEAIVGNPENRFMIFDNVSGLLPYMSVNNIVRLIQDVFDITKTRVGFQLIFLSDHDTDPVLVHSIENLCDKQFEISPSFFR